MSVDQTAFRDALLDPDTNHPDGLKDGQGREAGRRFDVYRNNVAVSLTEALETAFPVIQKLVGAENFKVLASAHLRMCPPNSPLMMFYGSEMPEFVENYGPTKNTGYLADVARLELALRESYHAADAEPIDPAVLQTMPPDELVKARIKLAPSLRLIRSDWPVHSIWRFNMEPGAPKPEMAAEDVMVVRADLDPEPHLLPHGGADFLSAISEGKPIGDALDAATSVSGEFDLGALLALLIKTQAMTQIGE